MKDKWYRTAGKDGDVVISTRVRLARNLEHIPFPEHMSPEQKEEVIRRVFACFEGKDSAFQRVTMSRVAPNEAMAMVERHLISPAFARCAAGEALLLNEDESVSMMINEEDHLRIQVMRPGFAPDEAFQEAACWDDFLNTQLPFAFDERLGYLTQCPTNLGTGMRASVMLHLPALEERGILRQLASTVSKLGLTIRGIYGEGSRPDGALYQLSNQVTLGITEQEAIDNLKSITAQIVKEERNAREQYRHTAALEDRVFRALGVLQNARLLSGSEFMSLISQVRIGIAMGLLDTVTLDTVNRLWIEAQPATLMHTVGKEMEPGERDKVRAELVREQLSAQEKEA